MNCLRALAYLCVLSCLLSFPTALLGEEQAQVTDERAQEISASLARLKGSLEVVDENRNPLKKKQAVGSEKSEGSFVSLAMKMGKGLAICVGVFFIGLSVMRRLKPETFSAEPRIKVRERTALTPKSSLLIVEIDGREQLITVGSENVSVITPSNKMQRVQERSAQEICANDMKLSA